MASSVLSATSLVLLRRGAATTRIRRAGGSEANFFMRCLVSSAGRHSAATGPFSATAAPLVSSAPAIQGLQSSASTPGASPAVNGAQSAPQALPHRLDRRLPPGAEDFDTRRQFRKKIDRLEDRQFRILNHRSAVRRHSINSRLNEPINEEQRQLLAGLRANAQALDWEGALSVMSSLPKGPELVGTGWSPVYRAILNVCCKALRYDEAHHVFAQLPGRDVMSYNMMLNMCSRLQNMDEVDGLLKSMAEDGVKRTSITYCTVMNAHSDAHRWEQALGILGELKQHQEETKEPFDWEIPYLTAMAACARGDKQEQTRALFNDLSKLVEPDRRHYNVLMTSCGKDAAEARKIFDTMCAKGQTPRIGDWNVLIGTHRDEPWDAVQRLYEDFRAALPSERPDEIWAAIIRIAFFHDNDEAAEWVMEEMRRCGVDPQSPRAEVTPVLKRVLRWKRERARNQEVASLQQRQQEQLHQQHQQQHQQPQQHQQQQAAAAASPPALPPGWGSAKDPASGHAYYWRESDPAGSVQWELPTS